MVLTSLNSSAPSGVRNRSTRAKPRQSRARKMVRAASCTRAAASGGMRAGQWMAEVLRVYFSSKSKKPPDSWISSTRPTVSSSLPSTAPVSYTHLNDASEHELYVAGKIRVNESGGHSGTDEGQNQRESHQDAYNKNNDNS